MAVYYLNRVPVLSAVLFTDPALRAATPCSIGNKKSGRTWGALLRLTDATVDAMAIFKRNQLFNEIK